MEPSPGFQMTREAMDSFLEKQREKGLTPASLTRYRYALDTLYQALPEDKRIYTDTLVKWREALLEDGFSMSTINAVFSISNSFLDYVGHREYQAGRCPNTENRLQPELTRTEYLRLLQTAKMLERERTYMIVKTLGSTGMFVHDLTLVTVEALRAGRIVTVVGKNKKHMVRLPRCLCDELLEFAERNGILSGPIFLTKKGQPVDRSNVASDLQRLGETAQLPEGKANGRALRRLWQQARANVEANMELLIEQAMDRQLEQEQLTIGWNI